MNKIGSLAELMDEADKAGQQGGTTSLSVTVIRRGEYQPRQTFDEAALVELAESIKAQGVVQPIVVRPDPEDPDKYILIAGERRWRATQMAGIDEIPVVIRPDIDANQALAIQLIENLDREDVLVTEEAVAVERLAQDFGKASDVAKALGKTNAWVSQRRKIAKGLPTVSYFVEHGKTRDPETLAMLFDLSKIDDAAFQRFRHQARVQRQAVRDALDIAKGKKPADEAAAKPEKPAAGQGGEKVSHVKKGGLHAGLDRLLGDDQADNEDTEASASSDTTEASRRSSKSAKKTGAKTDLAALENDLAELLGATVSLSFDAAQGGDLHLRFHTLDELETILEHIH